MIKYKILTCECGEELKVSVGAAGDSIVCPGCQRTVEVPSLRTLQTLPDYIEPVKITEDSASGAAKTTERDRRLGWMILLALIFAVSGIYTGYWGVCYYNSVNNDPNYWSVYETWSSWQFLRTGIETPLTYSEQQWFYMLRDLLRWIELSGAIAVLSLAGILYLWIAPYRRNRVQD